jgi:hypothetical protein
MLRITLLFLILTNITVSRALAETKTSVVKKPVMVTHAAPTPVAKTSNVTVIHSRPVASSLNTLSHDDAELIEEWNTTYKRSGLFGLFRSKDDKDEKKSDSRKSRIRKFWENRPIIGRLIKGGKWIRSIFPLFGRSKKKQKDKDD